MADFDPYRKWLGIPPQEQPPNHYRLLGIGLFESDPDVISNASDRQMFHVRTFQSGAYAEIAQFILNELSAARVCLLDPQRKAEYDHWLRQTLPADRSLPPPPRMTAMPPGMVRRARGKRSPAWSWSARTPPGMVPEGGAATAFGGYPERPLRLRRLRRAASAPAPWANPVPASGMPARAAVARAAAHRGRRPGRSRKADDDFLAAVSAPTAAPRARRHARRKSSCRSWALGSPWRRSRSWWSSVSWPPTCPSRPARSVAVPGGGPAADRTGRARSSTSSVPANAGNDGDRTSERARGTARASGPPNLRRRRRPRSSTSRKPSTTFPSFRAWTTRRRWCLRGIHSLPLRNAAPPNAAPPNAAPPQGSSDHGPLRLSAPLATVRSRLDGG